MSDTMPAKGNVLAYLDGNAFRLDVEEVECGHFMDARVAPQVREAIRVGREDGLTISIKDAFRTFLQQTRLHDGWTRKLPGFHPADPPGHSKHQLGTAIDLAFRDEDERERFAAIALAHGLTRPVAREPWHFVATPQSKESV